MSSSPDTKPSIDRRPRLPRSLLLGAGLGLLLASLVWALTDSGPSSGGQAIDPLTGVYPGSEPDGAVQSADPRRRLVFLPGLVADNSRRATELEAILRLHTYLAMRDVHSGGVSLVWEPASAWSELETSPRSICTSPRVQAGGQESLALLQSGQRADPLRRELEPTYDQRVVLRVDHSPSTMHVEAFVCSAQGSERSEVFSGGTGSEGVVLREMAGWLAALLGVADPGYFPEHWGRDPAPRGPALSTYGKLLVQDLVDATPARRKPVAPPAPELLEAAQLVPEASWLLAARSPDEASRIAPLRHAAALRVGFTAALEDLAASYLIAQRTDLALAALGRLSEDPARARPVELILASQLLDEHRPREAALLVEWLPEQWKDQSMTSRLQALLSVETKDWKDAERWAAAWASAEENSAEARVVHGRSLAALGRMPEAEAVFQSACRLDARWREPAVRHWLAAAIPTEQAGTVHEFLVEFEAEEGIELGPELRELRAYAALRAGDAAAAFADYDRLAEASPDNRRLGMNRCVAGIRAGVTLGADRACKRLAKTPLEAVQMELARGSRSFGAIPGYPADTSSEARQAVLLAPRKAEVSISALHILGMNESASAAFREETLAHWRVAVGSGVAAPGGPDAPEPDTPLTR